MPAIYSLRNKAEENSEFLQNKLLAPDQAQRRVDCGREPIQVFVVRTGLYSEIPFHDRTALGWAPIAQVQLVFQAFGNNPHEIVAPDRCHNGG